MLTLILFHSLISQSCNYSHEQIPLLDPLASLGYVKSINNSDDIIFYQNGPSLVGTVPVLRTAEGMFPSLSGASYPDSLSYNGRKIMDSSGNLYSYSSGTLSSLGNIRNQINFPYSVYDLQRDTVLGFNSSFQDSVVGFLKTGVVIKEEDIAEELPLGGDLQTLIEQIEILRTASNGDIFVNTNIHAETFEDKAANALIRRANGSYIETTDFVTGALNILRSDLRSVPMPDAINERGDIIVYVNTVDQNDPDGDGFWNVYKMNLNSGTATLLAPSLDISANRYNRSFKLSERGDVYWVEQTFSGGPIVLNLHTRTAEGLSSSVSIVNMSGVQSPWDLQDIQVNEWGTIAVTENRFNSQSQTSRLYVHKFVPTCVPCMGDFNRDGRVDPSDIFTFLDAFFRLDRIADINRNGTVSVQDIFDLLHAYFTSCS